MNVYKVQITSTEGDQECYHLIGWASAGNEYIAIKALGFENATLNKYLGLNERGKDVWTYNAGNAVNCLVRVTRV